MYSSLICQFKDQVKFYEHIIYNTPWGYTELTLTFQSLALASFSGPRFNIEGKIKANKVGNVWVFAFR